MTSLRDRAVLLTHHRTAEWAEQVRLRGGRAVPAPVQEFVPPRDPAALRRAVSTLAPGEWLVLTSPRAVAAVVEAAEVPDGVRVAVVGPTTDADARAAGLVPEYLPEVASAVGLLAQWPPTPTGTRILLPLSALAPDTLGDGLAARGLRAERVEAYRVEPRPLPPQASAALERHDVDAVVLSSASSARRFATLAPWLPEVLLAVGTSTAVGARAAGLVVTHVASAPTPTAVLDELASLLEPLPPTPTEETP